MHDSSAARCSARSRLSSTARASNPSIERTCQRPLRSPLRPPLMSNVRPAGTQPCYEHSNTSNVPTLPLRATCTSRQASFELVSGVHQPSTTAIRGSYFSQWLQRSPQGLQTSTNVRALLDGFEKPSSQSIKTSRLRVLQAANPLQGISLSRQVSGFEEATWLEERFALVVRANAALSSLKTRSWGSTSGRPARVCSWRRVRSTQNLGNRLGTRR